MLPATATIGPRRSSSPATATDSTAAASSFMVGAVPWNTRPNPRAPAEARTATAAIWRRR